jgi:hypothetical protein
MKLSTLLTALCATSLVSAFPSQDTTALSLREVEATPETSSNLEKRKGGGGGKGGGKGGGSSGGKPASSYSFSPTSDAGGRTISGSGLKPSYSGGRYVGGEYAESYHSTKSLTAPRRNSTLHSRRPLSHPWHSALRVRRRIFPLPRNMAIRHLRVPLRNPLQPHLPERDHDRRKRDMSVPALPSLRLRPNRQLDVREPGDQQWDERAGQYKYGTLRHISEWHASRLH